MSAAMNLSGSRSRTSTPIRAISSAIGARSSPTIPPAVHIYEPLVKAVLRHRLVYSIFSYSACLSWTLTVAWTIWDQGGVANVGLSGFLYNLLSPSIWFLSAMNWATGVMPILILRKFYLTAKPTTASSPSKTVQNALSQPSTLRALLTYVASAALVTAIHILVAYANTSLSGDPRLTVFVRSRKHPYYLNGRFVFLLSSQITLAHVFLLRNIMLDRFAFRMPSSVSHSSSKWPFTFIDLLKTTITTILFTTLSFTFFITVFGFARSIILPILFRFPFMHYFLRPFSAHFLRGAWTLWLPMRHLNLVCRTFFLGLTTVANWEFAEELFDVFVAQPILVSQRSADLSLTLISGITSPSDDYYRYFAYAELKLFATDNSPAAALKRTALFGDQKYNPSMWSTLVREALLLLGTDYQLFLRRGKPAPVVPPPPLPPKLQSKGPETPRTPLIQKQIFKSTARQSPLSTVLDSFASDSKLSQAVEFTAEAGATHLPELFRSVEHFVRVPPNTPASTPAKPKAVEGAADVGGLLQLARAEVYKYIEQVKLRGLKVLNRYLPTVPGWAIDVVGWWKEWWRAERLSKVVEGSLPRRELDIVVIEVLSHLICASLTEDRYGVVQRDIPRVLEAFLSFLAALEDYQVEIGAIYIPPSPDILPQLSAKELEAAECARIEVAKAEEALSTITGALKDSVARIVRTFGDKLLAFKFPPTTAKKLQGFINYN